jgi:ATP-dependent protease HslVU (ClpYQ) peptidase subunit
VTVIAGVVEGDRVFLGADSACTWGDDTQLTCTNRKVFRLGPFLVGAAGNGRFGDIVEHVFVPPKHLRRIDADKYLRTVFIDALREAASKSGILHRKDNVDGSDFELLIGYAGRLFLVDSDFMVNEPRESFAAIGSGGNVAWGALSAMDVTVMAPRKRLMTAMVAAERRISSVRRPFYVLEGA